MSKNAVILDGRVLKKGGIGYLQRESEVIIGGEPIIVSNYEWVGPGIKRLEEASKEGPTQRLSLKECLYGYYKYRKVADQRKEQSGGV